MITFQLKTILNGLSQAILSTINSMMALRVGLFKAIFLGLAVGGLVFLVLSFIDD